MRRFAAVPFKELPRKAWESGTIEGAGTLAELWSMVDFDMIFCFLMSLLQSFCRLQYNHYICILRKILSNITKLPQNQSQKINSASELINQ